MRPSAGGGLRQRHTDCVSLHKETVSTLAARLPQHATTTQRSCHAGQFTDRWCDRARNPRRLVEEDCRWDSTRPNRSEPARRGVTPRKKSRTPFRRSWTRWMPHAPTCTRWRRSTGGPQTRQTGRRPSMTKAKQAGTAAPLIPPRPRRRPRTDGHRGWGLDLSWFRSARKASYRRSRTRRTPVACTGPRRMPRSSRCGHAVGDRRQSRHQRRQGLPPRATEARRAPSRRPPSRPGPLPRTARTARPTRLRTPPTRPPAKARLRQRTASSPRPPWRHSDPNPFARMSRKEGEGIGASPTGGTPAWPESSDWVP